MVDTTHTDYPMNISGRLSEDESPADANKRRALEIKKNKFFQTDSPFSFKYPSTVAENFKEEINFNTHDSSEYALVRSSIDANGNQLGIDDDAIEPYVIFEFMRLMTDDKKKALSKWQDKNNFTRRNSSALKKEIDDLIKKLQPLGLASASRTGVVAMTKGPEIYKQH